ncbi:gene transfer agent family protein [Ancylobacter sp. Lp-2]|uniref:gene transfer agent family protein n=1 Tax=Ancylobacter sp. Lp-2 TaxID=2881339 RepID=UPI001E4D7192|nr:gene transfer agent family protein [Ancylobacter sp. Lp-2]MCB4768917.1 gene transfer agent family protein [Ancylobacter sp. Lp-2]
MSNFAVNRHRGEIAAELDGRPRRLVLTLGALAELESAFGAGDLVALAERFGAGRLSAGDAMRVIAAGLNGAGEAVGVEQVARMTTPGGATGFARIVGELIAATFGVLPDERPAARTTGAAETAPDPRVPRRD